MDGDMGRRVLILSVNRYDFPYPVYPLGAAQVAASLRRGGHDVRLVDYNLGVPDLGVLVGEFEPHLIGISLRNIDDALIQRREVFFEELEALCSDLHGLSSAPVVLGGSGFSIYPEVLLERSGADYGIQGEGEIPLLELLDYLERGEEVRGISGLVWRENGGVRLGARHRLTAPEAIQLSLDPEGLDRFYLERSSMLNLQTQRGCALKCCYCTYPILEGRKYRRRPGEAVAEELALMEVRGVKYVFIVDSVFNTSPRHVEDVCESILRRGVKLQWCCFLRPKGLTQELVQLMARAGLRHVEFGSDSLCDEVLAEYGKQLTFGDVLQSSELVHEAGLDYAHFLICGGPGETMETLDRTLEHSRLLPQATFMARVGMRVYPGTPLEDRYRREREGGGGDLLQPVYYLAEGLEEGVVFERLHRAIADMPNWIVDDPPVDYFRMAERLRSRGVVGPLWVYLAMLQRLRRGLPGSGTTAGAGVTA
ncbi:MAG: lipid biosynthesis B12-binding/radical SAM protein [Limisphaerales bacterium]